MVWVDQVVFVAQAAREVNIEMPVKIVVGNVLDAVRHGRHRSGEASAIYFDDDGTDAPGKASSPNAFDRSAVSSGQRLRIRVEAPIVRLTMKLFPVAKSVTLRSR